MRPDELPLEVQDWLQSIDAHRTAAERVVAFYQVVAAKIPSDHAVQLTQTWMMVSWGFPKNFPMPPTKDEE